MAGIPAGSKNNPDDLPGDLAYLHAELRVLDLRLQRAVRLWQQAGQNPLDGFRGLSVSDAEASALLNRPPGGNWGSTAALPAEEEQTFNQAYSLAEDNLRRLQEKLLSSGEIPRLMLLARAFRLDRFDLNILLLALAPAIDLRYERIFGYLQDDVTRKRPTVNLVFDLFGPTGLERVTCLHRFSDTAPLFRFHILELTAESHDARPGLLGSAFTADDGILRWLAGEPILSPRLKPAVIRMEQQSAPVDRLLVGEKNWTALQQFAVAIKDEPRPPMAVFTGRDSGVFQAAARHCAMTMQRPLMVIDLAQLQAEPEDRLFLQRLALRDGLLNRALLLFLGWDTWLARGVGTKALVEEALAYPGFLMLASRNGWHPTGIARQRGIRQFDFPAPGFVQRQGLWHSELGELFPAADLTAVSGQFRLISSQIRDAAALLRDRAAQGVDLGAADLFSAARTCSNPLLSNLARKITPHYTRADIILPADQLALIGEIVDTVRNRSKVLEEWGLGRKLVSSSGVTTLFAGPPGTGKTMAAEIIASELGLDLYKIDLSAILSKYIGETEKNLGQLFDEAETSDALLFFDEADALFSKRTEVKDSHDRYANIEINYLLQRMEAYGGVTVLATNLRSNLDDAFTRRLQFVVDFPFPDEEDRLRIWQTLLPPDVPRKDDLDLPFLARRYKLAGGSIRNILVGASYLAAANGGVMDMSHLLHSTRRELGKMGRLVGDDLHPEH